MEYMATTMKCISGSHGLARYGVFLLTFNAGVACGQQYPSKPIRIVSATAGSSADFGARLIAQGLVGALGQQVIVDNRPGTIPGEVVAKAAPDGYTVLVGGTVIWIEPLLRGIAPYNMVTDFSPITLATSAPSLLVVHPSLPVKSVRELIALAKSKPGALNSASGPSGGSPHLAAELFKAMAGVNIVHIPYRAIALALSNLIGGEVQLAFPVAAAALPHVKSGRLRALAVTSLAPSALMPELPAVAATLPGYEAASINGVFAPANTPAPVITRLHQETVRVLNQPETKEKFLNSGAEIVASAPDQLIAKVKSELVRMGKVIKDAGIRAE
jgi:tripartite-type tricarboxylate transporter receptor subunit TctC